MRPTVVREGRTPSGGICPASKQRKPGRDSSRVVAPVTWMKIFPPRSRGCRTRPRQRSRLQQKNRLLLLPKKKLRETQSMRSAKRGVRDRRESQKRGAGVRRETGLIHGRGGPNPPLPIRFPHGKPFDELIPSHSVHSWQAAVLPLSGTDELSGLDSRQNENSMGR